MQKFYCIDTIPSVDVLTIYNELLNTVEGCKGVGEGRERKGTGG